MLNVGLHDGRQNHRMFDIAPHRHLVYETSKLTHGNRLNMHFPCSNGLVVQKIRVSPKTVQSKDKGDSYGNEGG
jgi:hypothetical protein